jgi:hypothetical protein
MELQKNDQSIVGNVEHHTVGADTGDGLLEQ